MLLFGFFSYDPTFRLFFRVFYIHCYFISLEKLYFNARTSNCIWIWIWISYSYTKLSFGISLVSKMKKVPYFRKAFQFFQSLSVRMIFFLPSRVFSHNRKTVKQARQEMKKTTLSPNFSLSCSLKLTNFPIQTLTWVLRHWQSAAAGRVKSILGTFSWFAGRESEKQIFYATIFFSLLLPRRYAESCLFSKLALLSKGRTTGRTGSVRVSFAGK